MGIDPGPMANSLPSVDWAAAVWEYNISQDHLFGAVKRQSMVMAKKEIWSMVGGLVGAKLLSAGGWVDLASISMSSSLQKPSVWICKHVVLLMCRLWL